MRKSGFIFLSAIFVLVSCYRNTDVLVVGGGTSGVAAGVQASRSGVSTIIVEEGPWLGGMLTSAGVSAVDGNYKLRGGIFAEFCDSLASYYGGWDSLKTGWVSNILFEPKVGNRILQSMASKESLLSRYHGYRFEKAVECDDGWKVTFEDVKNGKTLKIKTKVMIDATELGDVAASCGVGYSVGMDSRHVTGESIAPEQANDIVQDMTYVLILKNYGKDADMTIDKPSGYDPSEFANSCASHNNTWPRPDRALWSPEQMLDYGRLPGGKYMLNWPIDGNDYYANVIEMSPGERLAEYQKAKNFSLCFLYYIQTELGMKNLGIADDEFPTEDGLPIIPYHRESRRIEGEAFFTVDHAARPFFQTDPLYRTGIAVGDYAVDHHHYRHPDWQKLPELHFYPIPSFSVPMGSLIPKKVENLIVAEKSISVSNLMNGSTRLQPVVMQIGQAAGVLAALSVTQDKRVRDVNVRDVQDVLLSAGCYLMPYRDLLPGEKGFEAIQRIGASGVVQGEGRNQGWANETWFSTGEIKDFAKSSPSESMIDFAQRVDSLYDPFHNVAIDIRGHYLPTRSGVVEALIGSGGHGHVFVGASVPHGMVQPGPNNVSTGWDWCSGYHDSDRTIAGFAQNHLSGTGIADLGEIVIMPFVGDDVNLNRGTGDGDGYAETFDKSQEKVEPSFYSVVLARSGIKTSITATDKVAYYNFDYSEIFDNQNKNTGILLDLEQAPKSIPPRKGCINSFAKVLNDTTLVGWRLSDEWAKDLKVFFAIRFSEPVICVDYYQGTHKTTKSVTGDNVRVVLRFGTQESLNVRASISYKSIDEALTNLSDEENFTFATVRENAVGRWERTLSSIDFKGISASVDTVFYTSLYHTAISPQLFSKDSRDYTIFSLWDTYRAVHPLYNLIDPSAPEYVNSLIKIAENSGRLPVWHLAGKETDCMVGVHSVHVIADAVLKQLPGVDPLRAWNQIKKFAQQPVEGLGYIDSLGWIPADKVNWSVSRALEYCIDDDAVARVASFMGDEKLEKYYKNRSATWKSYFCDGYMRGRMSDGTWRTPFNPSYSMHEFADFVEGNAWQYTWLVPHDVSGLIEIFGGQDAFVNQLDALFNADSSLNEGASADITGMIGQYAHGNEPSHHVAYLYAMAGCQNKTSELVRQICNEFYTTAPDGLIGNEDCGQMSAWYIFSALGFYPVHPLDGKYVLGSPLAEYAQLNLSNGKKFRVITKNNSTENKYIKSVKLNGKPYHNYFITYEDIMSGGEIEFEMTNKEN